MTTGCISGLRHQDLAKVVLYNARPLVEARRDLDDDTRTIIRNPTKANSLHQ